MEPEASISIMKVKEVMTQTVETIEKDENISDAARKMREKGIKSLLVIDKGKIIGIITTTDIIRKALSTGKVNTKVSTIMTKNVITISPETPVKEAAKIMVEKKIRHLPITEQDRIVGIISDRDILRALVAQK